MEAFHFGARDRNGVVRMVVFYAKSKGEAVKLAKTWAAKSGHTIEGVAS
jgi:hypothetical protein